MTLAEERFELIRPLLERYKRRFTVLDIGAGITPYVSQRISTEYDAVVTLLEKDVIVDDELAKLGPRAMWLEYEFKEKDIEKLAECQHFDVVIGLNILHHFKEWQRVAKAMMKMGHNVVVQSPTTGDKEACGQEVVSDIADWMMLNGPPVGESIQFPGHPPRPLCVIRSRALGHTTRTSFASEPGTNDCRIIASYTTKTITFMHKDPSECRDYIPGINLADFCDLGGAWPKPQVVVNLLRNLDLPTKPHGDLVTHNLIFDGKRLHLIDGNQNWQFDDETNLRSTIDHVAKALGVAASPSSDRRPA